MGVHLVIYNAEDTPIRFVRTTDEMLAKEISKVPEGGTWRVTALHGVPGIGNWSVDPPVYTLKNVPPLSTLPQPEGAPR